MTRLLTIKKGTDVNITFTILDVTGVALNLTGYTVYFEVRKDQTDPTSEIILSASQATHSNAVGGITIIFLDHHDTDKGLGSYSWRLRLVDGNGLVMIPVEGEFRITY